MRTIKFRAWDILRKRMIDDTRLWGFEYGELFPKTPDQRAFDLMQFTGLLDKNGKEIYEGDIIEHIDERYIVPEFTPLSRLYEAENIKPHYGGSDDWMAASDIDWEVIGNIYENPELLNIEQG